MNDKERFLSKIVKTDNGCWHWSGNLSNFGHGYFRIGKKMFTTSSAALLIFKKIIPNKTLKSKRICGNKFCVNPEHIEVLSEKDRFMGSFKKTNDGCWLFTKGIGFRGYGNFWVNGKTVGAHRFSYELFVGKIPKGKFILHSCDNRKCVNPKHLRIGSIKDNILDAHERNRFSKGDRHHSSKLSSFDVINIRVDFEKNKTSFSKTSKKYGVTSSAISSIIKRKTWRHI